MNYNFFTNKAATVHVAQKNKLVQKDQSSGQDQALSQEDEQSSEQDQALSQESSLTPPTWLSPDKYQIIQQLITLKNFKTLDIHDNWWYEHYYIKLHPFEQVIKSYTRFQQLIILKILRPERLLPAIQMIISEELDQKLIHPPSFDIKASYNDSNCITPLIFLISSGMDPYKDIQKLAIELGYEQKCVAISLGQGQGPYAEQAISDAIDAGTWVVLQNCHLSASWLPQLEKIINEINIDTTHENFRLWLTSAPSNIFPISILQNGIKMTNEPPKGIKANLTETYRLLTNDYFQYNQATKTTSKEEHNNPTLLPATQLNMLQNLLFSISFFHCIIQERRKFGSLGWNKYYEWNISDLNISLTQLKLFIIQNIQLKEDLPLNALQYLIGELNYGGRVTDEWDRRSLIYILSDYINKDIINLTAANQDYIFYKQYKIPQLTFTKSANDDPSQILDFYRNYIMTLPDEDPINLFGLHENVNITVAIHEANQMIKKISNSLAINIQSQINLNSNTSVLHLCSTMLQSLPAIFNIKIIQQQFPMDYNNSMNTVLIQELIRYNHLLATIKIHLQTIIKAIKGEVVMSKKLEIMISQISANIIPDIWPSYPSLSTLDVWYVDLKKRIQMFQLWIKQLQAPYVYWFPGFYFPQSFLTGILQNYARKYSIAIDQIIWSFEIITQTIDQIKQAPNDGAYISGLYIQGASWDYQLHCLNDAKKGILIEQMPIIWLKPITKEEEEVKINHSNNNNSFILL